MKKIYTVAVISLAAATVIGSKYIDDNIFFHSPESSFAHDKMSNLERALEFTKDSAAHPLLLEEINELRDSTIYKQSLETEATENFYSNIAAGVGAVGITALSLFCLRQKSKPKTDLKCKM